MKYKIYKYAGQGNMLQKGAEVTLYHGDGIAGHWSVEQCPGAVSNNGRWWHVFTIDGRTNQLKWQCTQSLMMYSNSSIPVNSSKDVSSKVVSSKVTSKATSKVVSKKVVSSKVEKPKLRVKTTGQRK